MYDGNGGLSGNTTELVSCGGKLLFMWEGHMTRNPGNSNRKQIWCAEITMETHDEGEVWGNVEWIDVVQSVPMKFELLRCLCLIDFVVCIRVGERTRKHKQKEINKPERE
ncbi:BnaC03g63390D [Brassica napus]|nr:BnaC03g63390D [Brassica napus]